MRNNKLFLAASVAALSTGLYSAAISAASVSTDASANVIAPLTITKTADLNFGDITHNNAAGTVTVDTAGVRTVGGAAEAAGGTVTASAYNVGGSGTKAYTITVPGSSTITNGTDTITVDTYLDSKGGTSSLTGGADSFTVGATLNFVGTESTGAYLGTFNMQVDYQ